MSFWGPKWPNAPKNDFFRKSIITISLNLALSLWKSKENPKSRWSYNNPSFLGPKWCTGLPKRIFSEKSLKWSSCTFAPLTLCKFLKKHWSESRVISTSFLGPKWPNCPERYFFPKKTLIQFWCISWPLWLS